MRTRKSLTWWGKQAEGLTLFLFGVPFVAVVLPEAGSGS